MNVIFLLFQLGKVKSKLCLKRDHFYKRKLWTKAHPPSPAFTYRSISVQIFVIGNHRGQHREYKGVEVGPGEFTWWGSMKLLREIQLSVINLYENGVKFIFNIPVNEKQWLKPSKYIMKINLKLAYIVIARFI